MARTKNRHIPQSEIGTKVIKAAEKTYIAGIYTRLSQERKEDYRDKSNSLEMQEELCIKTANEKDIKIFRAYKDYEYSGTNFKRPAFLEMMEDIRVGRINCIIVKDMSRFGREYLEIANYIEKIFPFLEVRFISVNDNLDTKDGIKSDKSYEIAIKNIFNDLYAKDISKKVKASKEVKMKQGSFIGAMAPYGYKVEKIDGKRVLVIDEKVADVVRLMFHFASQGKSNIQIARELTKTYTTPAEYKRTGRVFKGKEDIKQWDISSISKILSDEVYIGNLTQRVYSNRHDPSRKSKFRDKKEWIITENTHEALIEKDIFENIRQLKDENKGTLPYSSLKNIIKDGKENIGVKIQRDYTKEGKYDGLIKCGICGRNLKKQYGPRGLKVNDEVCYCYYCKGTDRLKSEKSHVRIYETDLDRILLDTLKRLFSSFYQEDKGLHIKTYLENMSAEKLNQVSKGMDTNNKKIDSLRVKLQEQYENYVKGEVLLSEFKTESNRIDRQIKTIKNELKVLDDKKRSIKKRKKELKKFTEALFYHLDNDKGIEVDKELVDTLISRIELSKYKQVTIYFRFNLNKDIKEQLEVEYE
ncbi:TPA: recombinase family protein [Streptococcus pyogenes]|jgi:site-specific recombinase|uniref:recombinase family protein n=1 Tax=Streptococcus intermedius TaxID=1338 RepID=UPI000F68DDDF|nr:recombinase family protein [Streptococcus intermedius]VRN00067.1 site-specific recombinase [Streptococcus pneumoniae]HES2285033.1 recombinase family protein [Streptococcus pyogenes]RSJ27935.1 Recombinase [Streptococcus intermedius]HEX0142079.1 recombinase family protein [Streptococcus pneumoniae]HEX0143432.1 recombinase family protein [Streptococcus pneumoniae]